MTMREEAGQRIASWSPILRTPTGWAVPSESADAYYFVELNDEDGFTPETWWERKPSCTCPDHEIRHVRCKHIHAVFALLRDLIREVGAPETDAPEPEPVQGYPQFVEDLVQSTPPFSDLLHQVLQGQLRLDEVYDDFRNCEDLPGATIEELWSELTFHRFMGGMMIVLRGTSYKLPRLDPLVQELMQQRHDAVAYELQKRAAPVLEARYNDFFGSQPEAQLGWTLWNLAMHGLDRPVPPLIPPDRRDGPRPPRSRQPAPGVEL